MMIDVHNHLGLSQDGGNGQIEELLSCMKTCRFSKAIIFATDEIDRGKTFGPPNQRILAAQEQYPKKFIAFCRINAGAGEEAIQEFNNCCRKGAKGLKLKASDGFEPKQTRPLLDLVQKKKGFPVLIHTAHNEHSQPRKWESIFKDYPSIDFILAHSGKDHYKECIKLAKQSSNLYLETSTLSYHRTMSIYEQAGPEKMVFGSDYPYSRPEMEKIKYDLLLRNQKERQLIFSHNPCKILGLL